MKINQLLILLLFLSGSLSAQKLKTFEVLGEAYGISYNKADYNFTICEKVNSIHKTCDSSVIPNDNIFTFQEKLKETFENARDSFKFKLFEKELKLSEFNTLDYNKISLTIDSAKLSAIDDEVEFELDNPPANFPSFKIKYKAAKVFELSSDGFKGTAVTINYANDIATTKAAFISNIQTAIDTKKSELASFYADIVTAKFTSFLQEFYNTTITKGADYSFLSSEKLNDNAGVVGSYTFYSLLEDKKFHIKICNSTENCNAFTDFPFNVSQPEFINVMTNRYALFANNDDLNTAALGKVYLLMKSKISETEIAKDKRIFQEGLKNKITELENGAITYSGQFVLGKSVLLYERETVARKKQNGQAKKQFFGMSSNYKTKDTLTIRPTTPKLIIDSLNIHIFNNRADNLTIVGRLDNDKDNTLVLTNASYSLPLREFRNKTQTNFLIDKNGKAYRYRYDDVLDYLPYNKYNYAVKNGDIKVRAGDTVKVVERKIGDYFTGIFFSDILGLNSNNGNSLITAEGRIRIPWHFRNHGEFTVLDNFTAYAAVNLVSGIDNNSRKITIDDTIDPDETSVANQANYNTNNFNLLINNNVDVGMNITPLTFEWKGMSTFIHARYGVRLLRTGAEYNLKERVEVEINGEMITQENILEARSFQIYSIGQEAEINFEIRPQASVGADLTVGLNWFRATGTNKNDIDFITFNNAPNLKVMANIYAFTDSEDSNSGVYVRVGGHYNLGNYKVFPQLMVGYATNLSSFVNKVAKD